MEESVEHLLLRLLVDLSHGQNRGLVCEMSAVETIGPVDMAGNRKGRSKYCGSLSTVQVKFALWGRGDGVAQAVESSLANRRNGLAIGSTLPTSRGRVTSRRDIVK